MADNKNVKKSSKSSSKSVNNTIVREVEHDYTNILNKMLLCLYVVIFVLVINTTLLLLKDFKIGSTTSETEETVDESEYDVSMFKEVTADTLKEQTAGDTLKVVYIGRSTCGYCVKFLPTLQQAQKDYGYETLYLDITTVTTTDAQNKILELDNEDGFLAEKFGSTPMVLLMKNSEIVDTWLGYDEYSSYAEWLEKNGFEK